MRDHAAVKRTDVDAEIARAKSLTDAKSLSEALRHANARVVIAAASAIEEHVVKGCDAALVETFARLLDHFTAQMKALLEP